MFSPQVLSRMQIQAQSHSIDDTMYVFGVMWHPVGLGSRSLEKGLDRAFLFETCR